MEALPEPRLLLELPAPYLASMRCMAAAEHQTQRTVCIFAANRVDGDPSHCLLQVLPPQLRTDLATRLLESHGADLDAGKRRSATTFMMG